MTIYTLRELKPERKQVRFTRRARLIGAGAVAVMVAAASLWLATRHTDDPFSYKHLKADKQLETVVDPKQGIDVVVESAYGDDLPDSVVSDLRGYVSIQRQLDNARYCTLVALQKVVLPVLPKYPFTPRYQDQLDKQTTQPEPAGEPVCKQ